MSLPPLARRVLLYLYIVAFLAAGLFLRHWTWLATANLHFADDIRNALFWGEQVNLDAKNTGFIDAFTGLYHRGGLPGHIYDLDYAPLRLLIMSLWAKAAGMPPRGPGHDPFPHAAPLLVLNTVCELASALAVFLIVHAWLPRCAETARPGWFRRRFPDHYVLICALLAATAAWLEPSMVLDAHAWPQWDTWIMPFYLFAAFAVVTGRWLPAGALIAIGAMIKPQILIVAPFFVLTPLCALQWRPALKFLAGFALAAGLIALLWLIQGLVAWGCMVEAALACAAVWAVRRQAHLRGGSWLFLRNVKQSETPFWCILVMGAAILLTGWLCGGDWEWLHASVTLGAKRPDLTEPAVWCNLAALLAKSNWSLNQPLTLPVLHTTLTLNLALRLAYLFSLILCSLGASFHLRRRDPRFLIAIALPWLLMFALLGQMHSRYLMWGAVASSLAFAVSFRLTLLHFLISAFSAAMILTRLTGGSYAPLSSLFDLITRWKPYAPWAFLACAAIFLWFTFWPSRRRIVPDERQA